MITKPATRTRRTFLKEMAVSTGALMLSSGSDSLFAQTTTNWKEHIGLELFTVRDLLRQDYEGVLAKLAKIGYKEVEPADPYNKMEPQAYKAMLDRNGLRMFSTHSGASDGPGLEKELEGQALMGIKYTEVHGGRRPGGPGGSRRSQSVESVKESCAELNKYGAIVKKFGMKILIHNHTGEFELLDDGKTTQYDVFLKETDPELVAMQLDIGWASVAGQDPIAMFKKNPGRFELWHVKDAKCKDIDPKLTPNQRMRAAKLATVGEGDVDYKAIFAHATLAGLKHFAIEQDNAGQGGRDAIEDCRIGYENLVKMLS